VLFIFLLFSSFLFVLFSIFAKMKWAGHVAYMGQRRGPYRGNLKGREHLKGPGVDGRKILK
jgi:hypothetical protein